MKHIGPDRWQPLLHAYFAFIAALALICLLQSRPARHHGRHRRRGAHA